MSKELKLIPPTDPRVQSAIAPFNDDMLKEEGFKDRKELVEAMFTTMKKMERDLIPPEEPKRKKKTQKEIFEIPKKYTKGLSKAEAKKKTENVKENAEKQKEIKMIPEMLNLLGCSKENFKKLLKKMNYKVTEKNNEVYFKYIPKKMKNKNFEKSNKKESPFGVLKNLNLN